MQHPNKKITDLRRLRRLYEDGAVFTAFDTETTGVTPTTSRIIEIGAVRFTKDQILAKWTHLFAPDQILSPFIIDLTHITQQMVDAEDPINVHLPGFLHFIKDTILVAHNAQFDLNFLNAECENCGFPVTKNYAVDTLQLSRIVFPEAEYHKLDFLADYLGIDKGKSHRAMDDAITCMELFNSCLCSERIHKLKRL
ncbi:MAG: 3'-5' exonuclease [Treponema sp.]|nr:3'-5' exonuclease [Treponema sp.]